ncbi:hypothetical protein [Rathayibacter sp. Leaf296]|nr:hypothetical protein [Rathayibacter sp. Leaf296]
MIDPARSGAVRVVVDPHRPSTAVDLLEGHRHPDVDATDGASTDGAS